jgi:hypothetical protein
VTDFAGCTQSTGMKTFIGGLCCLFVLLASTALAAEGITTIRTRDGKTYKGKVLRETAKGYLLRTDTETKLIEYGAVDDIHVEGEAPPPPPPNLSVPLPPPPPPAPPSTPAPMAAPPPLAPAAPVSELDAPLPPRDWMEANHGLHLGFGVGGIVEPWGAFSDYPVYGGLRAQFHLNFGFGLVDVRVSPTLGFLYTSWDGYSVVTFHGAVEAAARFNVTRVYALGVGSYQGLTLGSGGCVGTSCGSDYGAQLFFMPTFYPAIFRFGELAKNELSIALMFPVILTPELVASPYPYVAVAYSHIF